MSFGYNADIYSRHTACEGLVRDVLRTLVSELWACMEDERTADVSKHKPMIFLAHTRGVRHPTMTSHPPSGAAFGTEMG